MERGTGDTLSRDFCDSLKGKLLCKQCALALFFPEKVMMCSFRGTCGKQVEYGIQVSVLTYLSGPVAGGFTSAGSFSGASITLAEA